MLQIVVQGNSGCHHAKIYQNLGECALCFLRDRYEREVPQRLHAYKQIAPNGNPETSHLFLMHQETALGLVPPRKGQNLRDFRLARAQYSVAPGAFPVTSSLSKAMGYQPPIAIPVLRAIQGLTAREIAAELSAREERSVSILNVHRRMVKGLRLVMRMVRHAEAGRNQNAG